ncbi:phytanoyl-CoA dioxygenase family protein [Halorientalis regularis]|nr:phytanoyl-CoA dioxygenase family protein [Halorientalis regularis]
MATVAQAGSHAETLTRDGIVVIDDYLDADVCDEIYESVVEAAEGGEFDVAGEDPSYADLRNWDGPVVNKRSGSDEGMWDMFNVDHVNDDVADVKEDESIAEIISTAADETFSADHINVYWNRSVTNTRGFHADTYTNKFKSFVYLTDVPDRSYGPYTYIPGTHQMSLAKVKVSELVNKVKGNPSTDAVFYDESEAVHCTAPKGTLIISDQSGYHRGYPQEEGRERMILSAAYTPR